MMVFTNKEDWDTYEDNALKREKIFKKLTDKLKNIIYKDKIDTPDYHLLDFNMEYLFQSCFSFWSNLHHVEDTGDIILFLTEALKDLSKKYDNLTKQYNSLNEKLKDYDFLKKYIKDDIANFELKYDPALKAKKHQEEYDESKKLEKMTKEIKEKESELTKITEKYEKDEEFMKKINEK